MYSVDYTNVEHILEVYIETMIKNNLIPDCIPYLYDLLENPLFYD